MSEIVLPGPAPDNTFEPTKGPEYTKNGTNYWDALKGKVGGVDYSKKANLFGNTNMNCPNDKDDEKNIYVWLNKETTTQKWVNPNCHYQKIALTGD
jgi:hypothetical protein